MNTQKQIFLIVVLFFLFVGSCAAYSVIDLPYRSEIREDYHREESITRGALLYANNCRSCHGNQGEGGVGLPLNTAAFQDQDPLKLKANRHLLERTMSCGRAGTLMPSWLDTYGGALNERQIEHIVDFLTAPTDPSLVDENGNPTNKGWQEALEFAHVLNHELTAIVSGDTLDAIAKAHGIGPKELAAYNGLPTDDPALFDAPVVKGSRAKIPPTPQFPEGRIVTIYTENDTVRKIAEAQHVGAAIIAELNKLPFKVDTKQGSFTLLGADGEPIYGLFPGQKLALPEGATYRTAAGDTLKSVAEGHSLEVAALVDLNKDMVGALAEEDQLPPDLELALPGIKEFVVKGQSLEELAAAYGNVTAGSLGEANGIAADAVVQIGQPLKLPDEAWGTAPADTKNDGTACVQYAVSTSMFETIITGKAPAGDKPAVPENPSSDVRIDANANDWTVVADGVAQAINKGVVLVAKGTTIPFESVVGLHTITINGAKDDGDLKQGDKRTITFDTEGEFLITCDYHPDMIAWVFVQ